MKIEFDIMGEPYGKGRPRFSTVGGYVRTFTPEKTAHYENLVKTCWKTQSGVTFDRDVPLKQTVKAYLAIPNSWSEKKKRFMEGRPAMKKPDYDNLEKIISDSLNKLAFFDDSQIVASSVTKEWAFIPHVTVTIEEVE